MICVSYDQLLGFALGLVSLAFLGAFIAVTFGLWLGREDVI